MTSRGPYFLFRNRQVFIVYFYTQKIDLVFGVFMQKTEGCDHVKNNQRIYDRLQVTNNEAKKRNILENIQNEKVNHQLFEHVQDSKTEQNQIGCCAQTQLIWPDSRHCVSSLLWLTLS